jgi:site-specific recombinase XerD
MGQVARLPHVPPTVGTAVDNYLDGVELALTTRRVYTASLTGLAGGLGPDTRLGEVDAATVEGWFRRRYDGVSPATWNRELATLRSAIRWWRAQGSPRTRRVGWPGGGRSRTGPGR